MTEDVKLRLKELDWRARYDRFLHCDKAAVDIGISALKTVVLINAGAIVSLLALIGQLWNNQIQGRLLAIKVISECSVFGWGLVFGGIAFVAAYFYQSAITELARKELDNVFGTSPKPPRISRFANISCWFMIGLPLLSLFCFIGGVFRISSVLNFQP